MFFPLFMAIKQSHECVNMLQAFEFTTTTRKTAIVKIGVQSSMVLMRENLRYDVMQLENDFRWIQHKEKNNLIYECCYAL